jgi:hypothetical protein
VKRFTRDRRELFSPHESTRHQLQDERKFEDQKLNRLKSSLQTKLQAGLAEAATTREKSQTQQIKAPVTF